MLILVALSTAFGADGSALATAIEVDSADLVSADITGSTTAYGVLSSLGVLTPQSGSDFAYLFTGKIGTSPQSGTDITPSGVNGDATTLTLTLEVPSWAHSFAFDFNFMSAEYPEFVGSSYNDSFTAVVEGTAWTGDVAVDNAGNPISINNVLFSVTTEADLLGTGFDTTGGGTGWLSVVVPVDPGDTITLTFDIHDVADGIYDSGVLVDDFQWDDTGYDEPVLIEDIIVDYLSPKTGGLEGGTTTSVLGDRFNESCSVFFDGVEAETTFVNEQLLEAVIPPHGAPELVDVTVACIGTDETLVGGYTYYDVADGSVPPAISTVNPYAVGLDGGVTVQIEGEGFAEDAIVYVDEVPVETTFGSSTALSFVAPPHDAGLADVTVTNPDALFDVRTGALFYMDDGMLDEVEFDTDAVAGEGDDSVDLPSSGGCSSVPVDVAWLGALSWLSGAAAAVRRAKRGDV